VVGPQRRQSYTLSKTGHMLYLKLDVGGPWSRFFIEAGHAGAMTMMGDVNAMLTPEGGMPPGTRVRLRGRAVQVDCFKTRVDCAYGFSA
jgi:hypothetical protein